MGVNLYSLFVNLEAKGVGAVLADLRGVDAQGVRTAAALNGVSGSLDAAASAALNGKKGFKDISEAQAYHKQVLDGVVPNTWAAAKATEEHGNKAAKSGKQIKEHSETLHGLWSTLKQLAGAYFVFEGIHFIGETLEQAAALHELSQKTGVAAETLSVLQFAGRRANVSVEQLSMAFRGMALSLGNLRDGQEKTVAAYQRLGFTAESFKGLSPEQTFLKLAIAIGGMKDETERAETAQRVFGRLGAELVPLLEDLAENGYAKTREEAEKFNAVISQGTADAADKALDDWNDIKDMFKGLARETLPALTLAVRTLYEQLNMDLGDVWRNNLRELAGLADLFTKVMTLGVAGTDFSAHFRTGPKTFSDVESGASSSLDTTPAPVHIPTKEEIEEAKRKAKEHEREMLALLEDNPLLQRANKLGFQGVAASSLAVRGGSLDVSGLSPTAIGGGTDEFMGGSLTGDLSSIFAQGGSGKSEAGRMAILKAFANEAKRQAVELQVQFATLGQSLGRVLTDGFANALGAALTGKNPFKSFGKTVLAGLGGIFSQMGKSMLAAGLALTKLLPFMSNPITGGPALIAAGIILTGIGAALGAIATGPGGGSGGGGGGDFKDRTTQITLTANGMGGFTAPEGRTPVHYTVLGKDSPEGQRMFGEYAGAAKRSRNM